MLHNFMLGREKGWVGDMCLFIRNKSDSELQSCKFPSDCIKLFLFDKEMLSHGRTGGTSD